MRASAAALLSWSLMVMACGDASLLPAAAAMQPLCSDAVKNGSESDVDCGGSCPACADNAGCIGGADCASAVCTNQVCTAPSCGDKVKNGSESAIDCGGGCPACAGGASCAVAADCASRSCLDGACAPVSCLDQVTNDGESDVDCGGSCPACVAGRTCVRGTDCASRLCTNQMCAAPSCADKVRNGSESAIDCGGGCAPCAKGEGCGSDLDCASAACVLGACAEASCMDARHNGGETDVDCGGAACPPCANIMACAEGRDCASGRCVAKACTAVGTLADPGSTCADVLARGGSSGDGLYHLKPTAAPAFIAWCDMSTAPGGWTRVSRIALGVNTACALSDVAAGDPADGTRACTKYDDAVINALAPGKIFFSKVPGFPPLFTRYESQIRIDGPPGMVIQSLTLSDVVNAVPSHTTGYGSWVFFAQENWYQSDRCLGAQPGSLRLSLEYLGGSAASPDAPKYACTGACDASCPNALTLGEAEVYIR